jgi:hypothetical protein
MRDTLEFIRYFDNFNYDLRISIISMIVKTLRYNS